MAWALIPLCWCAPDSAAQERADPLAPYVAEAMRTNLPLMRERLAVNRADAGIREARSAYLPSLALDARYTSAVGNVIDIGDLVNPAFRALNQLTGDARFPTDISLKQPLAQSTTLRLVQPLFAPAAAAGIRLAHTQRGVDARQLALAARQLDVDVRLAYLDFARASQLDTLLRSTRALVVEELRTSERLLASGRVTPDAVARASADLSEVDQQAGAATSGVSASARRFNALLDRPFETPLPSIADTAFVASELPLRGEVIASALARRDELALASAGITAAAERTALARAAYLPVVALTVDYGFTGATYDFSARRDVLFTTVSAQWNLLRGGGDAARMEQAQLDRERATLQRRALEQQVRLDAENAWERAAIARDAIATASARLASATTGYRLVQRRYAEGLAPRVDLIDARSAYTNARINRVVTGIEYLARRVELDRAGVLRPSPDTTQRP